MSSLLIFIIQLYSFSLLAILLHYSTPRIGLAPLLFMLAGIIGLLNVIELNGLLIFLTDDIVLRPGGHIFVPLSLFIILMLYVVHGTRPARIAVIGILSVNILVFVTLMFLSAYVAFQGNDTEIIGLFTDSTAFNLQFIRAMLASLLAFAIDMLILIIVYQGANNHFPWIPKWIIPGLALIVALWTDSAVFNIGAFAGTQDFSFSIPGDVLIKTLVGVLLTPLSGWYLTRIAPKLPEFVGPDKRHTFAILRPQYSDARVETLKSELHISRSVYNQLTQHIEEIFWLIDVEERRFIYVSPAYERITKYSVEPLYEDINHLLTIMYHEDRDYTESDIVGFLTAERETEFRIESPDHIIRWLRARAFPIKDEQGNIIRYAGIAEDITEHKRHSEQYFELALARERMQILQGFIRDASHDLKTPISAIVLKLDVLDKIKDDERRRILRQELRGRAMYLSDLISDLFTLSYIESNGQSEMAEVDLTLIVENTFHDMQMLADEKGLTLNARLADDKLVFSANDEQIHRVVNNLITNAIRYTPSGTVSIRTWQEDSQICFAVSDTGIGIPQDSLHRVFERFFRTTQAKDTQEGTGLGLAICKAIVDKHQGTLSVESIEGEGATFTVKIPQTQAEKSSTPDVRRSTQEIRALPPDA